MSTISEVDLRDWEGMDFEAARKAATDVKDFQSFDVLMQFINLVEAIRNSQVKSANKHIPAILRKGEE